MKSHQGSLTTRDERCYSWVAFQSRRQQYFLESNTEPRKSGPWNWCLLRRSSLFCSSRWSAARSGLLDVCSKLPWSGQTIACPTHLIGPPETILRSVYKSKKIRHINQKYSPNLLSFAQTNFIILIDFMDCDWRTSLVGTLVPSPDKTARIQVTAPINKYCFHLGFKSLNMFLHFKHTLVEQIFCVTTINGLCFC